MTSTATPKSRDIPESDRLVLAGVDGFYGALQILYGIDLTVTPGEGVAIVGRNGAGKTSLLRAITGGYGMRAAGSIDLNGEEIRGKQPDWIARKGIILVPDDRRIFPLTVRENLQLAGRGFSGWQSTMDAVVNHFPLLKSRMKQRGDTLSGGEQQALAIARGFMGRPKYLLLDEPTEGLAPNVVQSLIEALHTLLEEDEVGLLLVNRSTLAISSLCARVIGMAKGNFILATSALEYVADSGLQELLLSHRTVRSPTGHEPQRACER